MKTLCKTLCFWATALLLGANVALPACVAKTPDRPLLVSARYYTPLSRPWDRSYYHLYRFNPDGSGKTQLTFAPHDDRAACWSPTGRQVAFARFFGPRYSADGDTQICVQAARPGAAPRVILRLHNTGTLVHRITWSGDGACLAVEMHENIIFVTPRGSVLRQMKADHRSFLGFAPDGKHYAVTTGDGTDFIVETISGRKTRLANAGIWWDSKTFLSWADGDVTDADLAKMRLNKSSVFHPAFDTGDVKRGTSLPMTFVNLKGNVLKKIALRPTALQRKFFADRFSVQLKIVPIRNATRVGPKSPLLCIEYGKPREQLFADTRTGALRRWQGQDTGVYPMQIAPDGRYAYSLRGFKDIAPYGKVLAFSATSG